jgi:hypothetical protein
MALQFMEGFDHYTTGQAGRKWTSVVGNGAIVAPGRFGGQAWQFNNVGTTSYLEQNLTARDTFILGVALQIGYGDATTPIIRFMDDNNDQVDIRVTSTAGFQFTRAGVPLGTTADNVIAFGYFNYIEAKVLVDNTVGYVQLRINGAEVLNVPALDTQATSNSRINKIRFQPFSNSGSYDMRLDDIYILDDTGTFDNAFLGECRVETRFPSANGAFVEFTPVGAGSNFQCVDETTSNEDTDYTQGNIVGNRDLFTVSTYSFVGQVYGVQVSVTHRKDDVGNRIVAPLARVNSTLYEGSQDTCLSQYKMAKKIWERNPNTNAQWTVADVNAGQYGIIVKG